MSKRKISDIILPNYWDLVEDGIGDQLERSRKLFLRGGRFSGKSYWAAHHIILTLMQLASVHKEGDPWACCLALRKYSNTLKTSVYAEIANAIYDIIARRSQYKQCNGENFRQKEYNRYLDNHGQ